MGFFEAIFTILIIIGVFIGIMYLLTYFLYGVEKGTNAIANKFRKSSSNEQTQISTEEVIDILAKEYVNELLVAAKEIAIEEGLLNNYKKNEKKLFQSFLNYIKENAEIDMNDILAITCMGLSDVSTFIMNTGYDYNRSTIAIFNILIDMQIYTNDLSIKEAFNKATDIFLYEDMIDYFKKMKDEN